MTPFEVPQFVAPFRQYTKQKAIAFAHRIGWLDDVGVFDANSGLVQEAAIPWWPECQLITMQSPNWNDILGAWVLDGTTRRLVRLDGTSPPIHGLNAKHGTDLTKDLVLAYLGFFCTFVNGDDGMFGIVGSGREAILPADWPHERLSKLLKPAKLISEDDGGFHVEASVAHGNALFWAHFLVQKSGTCEMLDDEIQSTDLDTRIRLRFKFPDKTDVPEMDAEDRADIEH